jgi:small subunit ribosomal protein S4
MSRYRGPKLRIIRRLGELPGLTQKICERKYPAGQHGPKKRMVKESQYALQLKEKQKLRFNYGLTERQLIRYVREAKRRTGSTGENLLRIIETRLDNVVFRLGFAKTIASARQLVNHGHISVNGRRVTIPSFLCSVNDTIEVREKSRNFIQKSITDVTTQAVPIHLDSNLDKLSGNVKDLAARDQIGININELLVVEYYSRKV